MFVFGQVDLLTWTVEVEPLTSDSVDHLIEVELDHKIWDGALKSFELKKKKKQENKDRKDAIRLKAVDSK